MTRTGYSTQYTTDDRLEQRWKQISSTGKQTPGVLPKENPLETPPACMKFVLVIYFAHPRSNLNVIFSIQSVAV